jgi:hypothetical protein
MYIPFMEVSVDNENLRLKWLEEFLRRRRLRGWNATWTRIG